MAAQTFRVRTFNLGTDIRVDRGNLRAPVPAAYQRSQNRMGMKADERGFDLIFAIKRPEIRINQGNLRLKILFPTGC